MDTKRTIYILNAKGRPRIEIAQKGKRDTFIYADQLTSFIKGEIKGSRERK